MPRFLSNRLFPADLTIPYEKYRVEEIQKDKETTDAAEGTEPFPESHHSAFAAYAILILKKFLELFERTTEQGLEHFRARRCFGSSRLYLKQPWKPSKWKIAARILFF